MDSKNGNDQQQGSNHEKGHGPDQQQELNHKHEDADIKKRDQNPAHNPGPDHSPDHPHTQPQNQDRARDQNQDHQHHTPDTVPDWSELGRGTRKSPKGVREILKTYFNDAQIDRADQYHTFFTSWRQLAGINIAAHTRPRDIRNRVLIIEADHPGWVQLLQMQKRGILRKIRRDFPQLDIKDLRIVVGELPSEKFDEKSNATDEQTPPAENNKNATGPPASAPDSAKEEKGPPPESPEQKQHKSRFEQALEKLGKSVEEREKDK